MRSDPDPHGGELELLTAYLEHQRSTVLAKAGVGDLTRQQPPSTLTLAGLLHHLALVEERWMEVRFAGMEDRQPWAGVDFDADREWEFRTAAGMDPEELRERYRQACRRSDEVIARASGPEQLSVQPLRDGRRFSLRWVLLHLIEETARHAGHADLLREATDGSTGE